LVAAAIVALLSNPLPAQGFVDFLDGSRVEGKLVGARKGTLKSVFGYRAIDKKTVAGSVDEAAIASLRMQYQEQSGRIAAGFNGGRVALARWCIDQGLLSGAKEQLELVFKIDPDFKPAQRLAFELARTWMFEEAEGATRPRDQRRFIKNLFSTHAARDLTSAMMAAHKVSRLQPRDTLRPAIKGLKHRRAGVRWLSARTLAAHRDKPERIKPLYRRALMDPAPVVRREAVRSLKVTQDPVFARLFAKNLGNPKQRLRMTAAEALGELGMKQGVQPLIGALKAVRAGAPNGGVRANIAITTQRAYVKDFDVEIAQAAVIADPIVDIVTEGVVLDVTVVGVSVERGAYTGALRRLTGVDLGNDWRAWEDHVKRAQSGN